MRCSCWLTLVALLLYCCLFTTLTESAGPHRPPHRPRGPHSLFTTRPKTFEGKYLKSIEVLQSFQITHSNEAKPLAGFHPEAPAIPKPEKKQTRPDATAAAAGRYADQEDTNSSGRYTNGRYSSGRATGRYSAGRSGQNDTLEASIDGFVVSEEEDADAPETANSDSTDTTNDNTNDDDDEYDEVDLDHWSVNGAPHTYHKGQAQLFPDKIQLEFIAYGERIHLELHIMRDLFNEHSVATLYEGDRVVSTHRHVLQSYWTQLENGWATATLHRNGQFRAVVHRDGETIQVDPVEVHKQEMEEDEYNKLVAASTHHTVGHPGCQKGMVVHRHSDFKDITKTHICGSKRTGEEKDGFSNSTETILEEGLHPYSATARRLLQASVIANAGYGNYPTPSIEAGLVGWTSCYYGDTNPQRISVGFAVDTGMYNVWQSVTGVQQYIGWQISVANLVYLVQLHVFLTISDINIQSVISTTAPSWNDAPPCNGCHCTIDINTKLNTLSAWRGSAVPTKNSIWQLQTNCYPPSGVVGLAWIGALCNTYYGVSISTYLSNQWLTTAHEIGHNFGASHTFQLGTGTTGGIMDYGDGKLNGIFQFYTLYSQSQMCGQMSTMQGVRTITPYCSTTYTPSCGNSILEPGETCDDRSPCCNQPGTPNQCQLTSTSQCSGETPCCTGCKFKPTSTLCLNGKGYCRNGWCSPSVCGSFSGLSFCGMVPTNPCRQQCLSASTGVCSDSYTNPNLNVPDGGYVCNLSPYGTCLGGVCTSSGTTVTYSWSTGAWSACDCTGSQTRPAYCLGSDGSVGVAGTNCPYSTEPALAQSCTKPSTCVTYSWKVSAWSTCSVDCGGGMQSATVQCVASDTGLAVADSSCTTTKPSSTQACNTQACPTTFVYSAWSACSVGCGGGISTRTYSCVQTQNGVQTTVSNSLCTGLLATSQACNTAACVVVAPTVTYTLTYGTWSTCSVSCGGGTQTRPASCVGSDGVTYDLSKCSCGPGTLTPTCPNTVQTCNTALCPSYSWSTSAWSTCSVSCGGGLQTRNVVCKDTVNNIAVADTYCLTAKPSGVQSCNTQTCTTYTWTTGLWQPCSKPCGGGLQTRAVSCVNSNNIVQPVTSCDSTTKPVSQQACNLQTCPTYQWLVGAWSTCSAWCGGGTQTRSVSCVAIGSLTPTAYSNCDTTNIPVSAQYCNTAVTCPLNSDTQWVLSAWSDCSMICGGDGIRNRTVICTNSTTGLEIDPKYCPSNYVPEVSSVCANISCPTYWYTTPWSTCTANCDSGTQSRQVECRYVNGGDTAIDDSLCTGGTRPSTDAECNVFPCPTWVASPWSDCSTRCNDGIQTRRIDCVTWDNQNTTVDQCASTPAPITSQTCSNKPCPHWHRGPWSYCDAPCTSTLTTGKQTRSLVCRMPHDDVWHGQIVDDDTLCPPVGHGDSGDGVGDSGVSTGKPASWQLCNQLPCPNYYWDVVKWSDCSVGCGGGSQTGTAVCKSNADDSIVSNNLCLGTPPATTRTCNVDPCPVYAWMATEDWSSCSVLCGSGTQTRAVWCVNTSPAEWKHVQYEITHDESLCAGQPKLATIQPCTFPKSVCWGNGANPDTIANGLCASDGTCLCRAGWAGLYCEETPKFTNVLTNGASFTSAGIPFGDILQVKWQSTGSLPYVSVLLIRSHASDSSLNWPVASYIAKDIINTGTWTWTVGAGLPDLESGDGFTVRIWFSDAIWAENATPFTIADPCAYKSCGIHGTCGLGGVCQCVNGYSGDTCALGPCERAHCSTSYGSCLNEDYIGLPSVTSETVGICKCGQSAGGFFDGFQCRTPPGCTPKCKNGADLFNTIIDLNGQTSEAQGECGLCGCMNMWGGDTCDTCSLRCANGGVANDDCTACDCTKAVGFTGTTCGCKYYSITLRLDLSATFVSPTQWITNNITTARVARTLAIDLALASGQVTGVNVQINVLTLRLDPATPGAILADIQFGLECPVLADDMAGGASVNTEQAKALRGIESKAAAKDADVFNNLLSPYTIKNPHYSAFFPNKAAVEVSGTNGPSTSDVPSSVVIDNGRPTLTSVYALVVNMFEDLSSPVYRGVITSRVTLASVVSVQDLSGQDSPRAPSSASDPFQVQQSEVGGFVPYETSSSSGLSKGAIAGIIVGIIVALACMCGMGYYIFKISGHTLVYEKPRLAQQHQSIEGGTQLASSAASSAASSQNVTPADTPHHTPPTTTRSIVLPPHVTSRDQMKYLPSPSADFDEKDQEIQRRI